MKHHSYFNGIIQASEDTHFKINDLALLRGYGLFDYFRTYNGKPFQWDLYWQRFENSAKLLNIENPICQKDAFRVVMELIEKSGLADCAIRFLLTGGYAPNGVFAEKPNLLISSETIQALQPEEYQTGIKLISHEYIRDLPEIKSIDYKHLLMLQSTIKAAGASDVLFHKHGIVSELSRSNFFMFKNNVLITPKRDILKGITRHVVMALAKNHFEVIERDILFEELFDADELFTTSSTKRVLTIHQVDNQIIGSGKLGKKTGFIANLFNDLITHW